MAKRSSAAGSYYYAGGRKIKLTPAKDLLAIEGRGAKKSPESSQYIGQALMDGLHLVTKNKVPAEDRRESQSKYPVFRSHGAIVVALPEVRVEESDHVHRAKLDEWLTRHGDAVTVISRDEESMVLRPVSGSGEDALAIANDLAENIGPELAQARFIRVVPRTKS